MTKSFSHTTTLLLVLLQLLLPQASEAFVTTGCKPSSSRSSSSSSLTRCYDMAEADRKFLEDFQMAADKLQIEKARQKLENSHTRKFLKSRPFKLPYEVARKWVQANLGVDTKEEFDDFVANGKLRTAYIPKQPEEYYTRTREWISWDHFLTGMFDNEKPNSIGPATGAFD